MKMKAMIWTAYGPPEVLELGEIDRPKPGSNEILVKVCAGTVTAGDCELRRFEIAGWIWIFVRLAMGIFRPRIPVLGQEVSGTVAEVGEKVEKFKVGDEIFAECGMKMGAYAEYTCLSQKRIIAIKPKNLSLRDAATIPTGGINGLHFLRKGEVGEGDRIVINGAGGSIGTCALQIAKLWGAEVTCIDRGDKAEMLRSLGADQTFDYQKEDFTSLGDTYDVIIDIVGNLRHDKVLKILKPGGRFVQGNPRLPGMLRSILVNWFTDKKSIAALAPYRLEDFEYVISLIEAGHVRQHIDRTYPLEELVEAHRYVEGGGKKGHVVVEV